MVIIADAKRQALRRALTRTVLVDIIRSVERRCAVRAGDGRVDIELAGKEFFTARLSPGGKLNIRSVGLQRGQVVLPDPLRRNGDASDEGYLVSPAAYKRDRNLDVVRATLHHIGVEPTLEHVRIMDRVIQELRWFERMGHASAKRLRGVCPVPGLGDAVRELIHPQLYEHLRGANKSVRLDDYNRLATNRDFMLEMERTNPMVVGWVAHRTNGQGGSEPVEVDHPGEIVKDVRGSLERAGLQKSSWRQISKLRPDTIRLVANGVKNRGMATMIFDAIAKYQIKDPTDDQVNDTLELLRSMAASRHIAATLRGPKRERWIRIFGIVLRRDATDRAGPDELSNITDYIKSKLDDGEEITATTWGGLLRASEQWHREQVHREMLHRMAEEKAQNEGKIRAWNSLLPTRLIYGHEVTPLTDVMALWREGVEMHHCVGSYGRTCQGGGSRIFSIRGDGGIRATAEISRHGERWSPVQVRGHHNERVSEEVQKVAAQVAKLYQEMWDGTDAKLRSQELWVFPDE